MEPKGLDRPLVAACSTQVSLIPWISSYPSPVQTPLNDCWPYLEEVEGYLSVCVCVQGLKGFYGDGDKDQHF